MPPVQQSSSGPLRPLKTIPNTHGQGPQTKESVDVNVVAVPGISSHPVEEWGLENLIKALSNRTPRVVRWKILAYSIPSDVSSLKEFFDLGTGLLGALQRIQEGTKTTVSVFIAHSLGGSLVKKAINSAYEQAQRFEAVLQSIASIVFLGCPHLAGDDAETGERFKQILQCVKYREKWARHPALNSNEVYLISELAYTFEENPPDGLILSVFDGQKTKLRGGLGGVFKGIDEKLVDESLARTSIPGEETYESTASHWDLCKFESGKDIERIAQFLARGLEARNSRSSKHQASASRSVKLSIRNIPNPQAPPARRTTWKADRALPAFNTTGSESQIGRPPPPRTSMTFAGQGVGDWAAMVLRAAPVRKAKLPCHILPRNARDPDFFGRVDELKALAESLVPAAASPAKLRQYAIYGMGGVGKTELAVEFVYSTSSLFQGVFWIDAAEPTQLASGFSRVATQLGLDTPGQANDLVGLRHVAKQWLSTTSESWLLVFDNVDDISSLTDYWPTQGIGSVLVTSRDPSAKTFGSFSMPGIELEPFTVADAAELIRKLTDSDGSKDEVDASKEMAKELGCLPLAIIQMSGYIRRRQWSLCESVQAFQSSSGYAKMRDARAPQISRYGSTLATAWNFNDPRLGVEAKELLKLISVLSPDRIKEYIFTNASHELGLEHLIGSTHTGSRPTTGPEIDPEDWFEQAKEQLLRGSTVKRNKATKELSIHRIVSHEIREWLPSDELFKSFHKVAEMLCHSWPFNDDLAKRHARSRWSKCDELSPHLESLHRHFRDRRWLSTTPTRSVVRLFQEAGAYLHERGFSLRGRPFLEDALDMCKRLPANAADADGDRTLICDIYYTLGAIANEVNDGLGCLENNIILLNLRREEAQKLGGRPDVRLAAAHSQIGIAYMMTGKLALATRYFQESIAIFKGLDDFDVDMLGFPMANLGMAYWVQGLHDLAEKVLSEALEMREKRFGKMDKVSYKTGRILHGLGNVKASQAELAEQNGDIESCQSLMAQSWDFHKKAMAQLESTLGSYHHRVADLSHKLAEHYERQGEFDLATQHYMRAMAIWLAQDCYQNQTARTAFSLGNCLLRQGDATAADGTRWVDIAKDLYLKIRPGEDIGDLQQSDFDDLVVFWSR